MVHVFEVGICTSPGARNVVYSAFVLFKWIIKQIVSFDCRGLEPIEWENRGGFVAKTEKGKEYEVKLEDNEFYDYDDDANCSISITNIENQFKKLKGK